MKSEGVTQRNIKPVVKEDSEDDTDSDDEQ